QPDRWRPTSATEGPMVGLGPPSRGTAATARTATPGTGAVRAVAADAPLAAGPTSAATPPQGTRSNGGPAPHPAADAARAGTAVRRWGLGMCQPVCRGSLGGVHEAARRRRDMPAVGRPLRAAEALFQAPHLAPQEVHQRGGPPQALRAPLQLISAVRLCPPH